MRRIRALLALTALATAMFVGLAPAAHATTSVIGDPSYDNGSGHDGRGDIVSGGGSYNTTAIGLGVSLRIPESPSAYNWSSGRSVLMWDIAVNHSNNDDYIVGWDGRTAIVDDAQFNTLCQGNATYDGNYGLHIISFDASCIGSPSHIDVRPAIVYTDSSGTQSIDWIGSGSGDYPVHLDRDQTAPPTTTTQPPTTTTTNPDPSIQAASHGGYWMVSQTGHVSPFGVQSYGDAPTVQATHIEATPTGAGYWVLAANGTVFPFGDAAILPSAGMFPGENAVSLSATPTGAGYWVFTDRGRVVNFGDAQSFGDMSGTHLNGPILGSVATPTGHGYWMVGSDGGIFSFGDATFHGSTGGIHLNKPVMAMAPAPDGYWLVASDGGVFAFDAPFYGSMGAAHLNKPISGMVPGPDGYMMVGADGGIFAFGRTAYHGSLGANPSPAPIVSAALQP